MQSSILHIGNTMLHWDSMSEVSKPQTEDTHTGINTVRNSFKWSLHYFIQHSNWSWIKQALNKKNHIFCSEFSAQTIESSFMQAIMTSKFTTIWLYKCTTDLGSEGTLNECSEKKVCPAKGRWLMFKEKCSFALLGSNPQTGCVPGKHYHLTRASDSIS